LCCEGYRRRLCGCSISDRVVVVSGESEICTWLSHAGASLGAAATIGGSSPKPPVPAAATTQKKNSAASNHLQLPGSPVAPPMTLCPWLALGDSPRKALWAAVLHFPNALTHPGFCLLSLAAGSPLRWPVIATVPSTARQAIHQVVYKHFLPAHILSANQGPRV